MSTPQPLRPALYLDRDGIINEDTNFLYKWEDCRFVPGIVSLIATANRLGYAVIVVTNQSGIGRGMYTEEDFHVLMERMTAELAAQGARLDAVYFSPFHPVHGIGKYQREDDSRKPSPGMLLRAAQEHGLDPARSVMVGDRCSDLAAGHAAGVPNLFLFGSTEPLPCPAAVPYTHIHELNFVERHLERLSGTASC
jgi:D-glycero-D-manno-heptose 1,7-bisphosphate phosphatase